ncbi:hypothetical protein O988_02745 [Pseudogymnoascus sp. VKM F-3808]|nr:hypothetical protein O988_02745 [Pseudogymnoascus sp. VKM F-3808]
MMSLDRTTTVSSGHRDTSLSESFVTHETTVTAETAENGGDCAAIIRQQAQQNANISPGLTTYCITITTRAR